MSPTVRCGLVQCSNPINDESVPVAKIQQAMLDKHLPFIEKAAAAGVQILCVLSCKEVGVVLQRSRTFGCHQEAPLYTAAEVPPACGDRSAVLRVRPSCVRHEARRASGVPLAEHMRDSYTTPPPYRATDYSESFGCYATSAPRLLWSGWRTLFRPGDAATRGGDARRRIRLVWGVWVWSGFWWGRGGDTALPGGCVGPRPRPQRAESCARRAPPARPRQYGGSASSRPTVANALRARSTASAEAPPGKHPEKLFATTGTTSSTPRTSQITRGRRTTTSRDVVLCVG